MIGRIQIILFILIFAPLSGYGQLESIEGYWFRIEQSDTIILKIEGFSSKRRMNDEIRKGLQRSTNRQLEGLLYFSFDNDSLSIIDAYGNVKCKSRSFKINSEKLEFYEGCSFSYSRITKEVYNKLKELIEAEKRTKGDSEDINKVDY